MRRNTFDLARAGYLRLQEVGERVDKDHERIYKLEDRVDGVESKLGDHHLGAGGAGAPPMSAADVVDPKRFDRFGTIIGVALVIMVIVLTLTGGRIQ